MHSAGEVVADRYRLEARLEGGPAFEGWRAFDSQLGRMVRLRFLGPSPAGGEDAAARCLIGDARAAASFRHENVAQALDSGLLQDGRPFAVVELPEGGSLAERLREPPPVSAQQFGHWMAEALLALAAVREAGLAARELTAQGIVLQPSEAGLSPIIVDVGVPRPGPHDGSQPRPEVYAVGAILYEGLTGQAPATGTTPSSAHGVCELRPDLPALLAGVIDQALSSEPGHSFTDARVMHRALTAALAGLPPDTLTAPGLPLAAQPHHGFAAAPSAISLPPSPQPVVAVSAPSAPAWGDLQGLDGAAATGQERRAQGGDEGSVPTVGASNPAQVSSPPSSFDATELGAGWECEASSAPLEIDYQRGTRKKPQGDRASRGAAVPVRRSQAGVDRRGHGGRRLQALLLLLAVVATWWFGPPLVLSWVNASTADPPMNPPAADPLPAHLLTAPIRPARRAAPGRHRPALRDVLPD